MKTDKVKDYYNEVAEDYNDVFYIKNNEYPPLKYRHKYILKMINDEGLPSCVNILDIGCGPGELVIDLSKKFDHVYGIDISKEMIRIAGDKLRMTDYGNKTVVFDTGDIEKLSFSDGYFDVVVCSGVVEYLKNDEVWIKEIWRVLKPKGIMIVNVTNKYSLRRWSMPFFNILKSLPGFYALMNFIKTRIFKMGKLNKFPFKPRVHCPSKFDIFLNEHKFEKISHNYFDFSIFPYPLDTVLNFMLLSIRKRMENRSASKAYLTGNGYIVKCRKLEK